MIPSAREVLPRLAETDHIWLFLDYDGTLADFSPTPDVVTPDGELIDLLARLADKPDLHLAVVSGRRLKHIRKLVPVPGIWLAGTYGIELLAPTGETTYELDYQSIRPALEQLKQRWGSLIAGQSGFYLEDKGWTLAIHARYASNEDAAEILSAARQQANQMLTRTPQNPAAALHLLGGHKFLEICPKTADKGAAFRNILSKDPFIGALPVFIGDDDKDEKAFAVVKTANGLAILVAAEPRPTQADFYLETPAAVRDWLASLLQSRASKPAHS